VGASVQSDAVKQEWKESRIKIEHFVANWECFTAKIESLHGLHGGTKQTHVKIEYFMRN